MEALTSEAPLLGPAHGLLMHPPAWLMYQAGSGNCFGKSGPQGAQPPGRHLGEAEEVAVSHSVMMEVALSFLGTENVTYFLVTRMLLQH